MHEPNEQRGDPSLGTDPGNRSHPRPTEPTRHRAPADPRDDERGAVTPSWAPVATTTGHPVRPDRDRAPQRPRVPALPTWARLPMSPRAGWIATGLATLLAAVLRLVGLDRITSLIFDETYYVKEAYSYAQLGYAGKWVENSDERFVTGDFSGLTQAGDYVVHPMTGKWLIAIGGQIFGWDNPVGWRFSAAVAGTIGVFLLCRIAWNLFRSPTIVALAGVFLATDGIDLVLSRTSLLDVFLSTFVLGAFLAVIKDQQEAHPRLLARLHEWRASGESPGSGGGGLGPHSGSRPWLLVAGVLLGLACSVKWSGIYAVAVLGVFVVVREWTTRRRAGHPRPLRAMLVLEAPLAFLWLVGVAALVYIASWWSWMIHPKAWGHGVSGLSGPLGVAADLWDYHTQMWSFHTHLTTPHNYQSQPWTWLFQLRPTSFAYEKVAGACGSDNCVRNVVALGNPLMWWLAVPALALALWAMLRWRNWRIGLVVCGYVAMYLPWFMYSRRTIFTFYSVAFVPCVALVLAWALGVMLDQARLRVDPDRGYSAGDTDEGVTRWLGRSAEAASAPPMVATDGGHVVDDAVAVRGPRALGDVRAALASAASLCAVIVVACAAYFYTVWTGVAVPYQEWLGHMWLHSWI